MSACDALARTWSRRDRFRALRLASALIERLNLLTSDNVTPPSVRERELITKFKLIQATHKCAACSRHRVCIVNWTGVPSRSPSGTAWLTWLSSRQTLSKYCGHLHTVNLLTQLSVIACIYVLIELCTYWLNLPYCSVTQHTHMQVKYISKCNTF